MFNITRHLHLAFQPTVLTVALMLQCCVWLSSVYLWLCIAAKWCVSVLQQKLLLTAYRKSYMRNRQACKSCGLYSKLGNCWKD